MTAKEIYNQHGQLDYIETDLKGILLLDNPFLNKDCAFSAREKLDLGLTGLLPDAVELLDDQVKRMYAQYLKKTVALEKNVFLYALHDRNETLFYKLVSEHLDEMLPIIYTPTIGDAVENFSTQFRRTRGLFLSYPNRHHMREMLQRHANEEIDLIVVTDGEGVLGIGDWGIGGMDISIGKLMVYTACGGINPRRVLPIQLDVGTNNKALIDDPMYLGWRNERLTGKAYDEFIDIFVSAVREIFPQIYLHWEDFGRDNARKNLNRYRQDMCTFNDDMQGTALIALSNVLAATNAMGESFNDHKIVMFGAGTAGVGIVDQLCSAMVQNGLSLDEARARFWLIDREGLLLNNMDDLPNFQKPYLRAESETLGWQLDDPKKITLADVVRNTHPSVLIGCSTVKGAFTESIVKDMATHCKHPIIMPLSNPTSRCEAEPKDLIFWTNGKAFIAAGSPFPPVEFEGKNIRISQGNNAFVFPGLGLGVIAAKASRVTDAMLYEASLALSACSPTRKDHNAPLLPDLEAIKNVSEKVALAVAEQARKEGVAGVADEQNLSQLIKQSMWQPEYVPYRHVDSIAE